MGGVWGNLSIHVTRRIGMIGAAIHVEAFDCALENHNGIASEPVTQLSNKRHSFFTTLIVQVIRCKGQE